MTKQIAEMANQAIFQMQFNFGDAVRYVMRNSKTDQATARSAVQQTVTWHKQHLKK